MAGFEQLPGAIDPGAAQDPIQPDEVRVSDQDFDDETALGIVLSDTADALSYYESKGLIPLGLEAADDLIRAYVRPRQWADGKPRASLGMHTTLLAIEKIMPALYLSLFGKKKPFLVDPVGKTKPEAARANSSLLMWAIKQCNLKEEMRVSLKTALTYGFMVGCWGWESRKQRKKVYAKKNDKMVGELKETDIEIPCYETCDLRQVLVDPMLKRQDVHAGAKYIIKQTYIDAYALQDLRDNPDYKDIPSQEELAQILATKEEPVADELAVNKRPIWREFQAKLAIEWAGKDPMQQPLELLEYTTKDRVITILQRRLVIRNQANEYGKLNFQSCSFIDVLGSAWGFGVAKLLTGEQRLQQGVINNYIDSLALVLNPVFQLLKGIGPGTQAIPVSPGRVITESGELKPLVVPDITKPAMEAMETSQARAEEKVGANGGSNMPNSAMRTAQGVQAFAGDVVQRLQYWLEQFINLVYIPTLEAFLMIMKDHLTIEQVQTILTAEEGKAYEGDISEVYNAEVNVDVVAGANMLAKFAAAQLAPMIVQLVSSGPVADQFEVAGKKFDYAEFTTQALDMMGWDVGTLITDMTPADLQRVQQKNAALTRVQGDMALQNQKHQDDLQNIDAKASGQAGVAVVRTLLKTHENAALSDLQGELGQEPPDDDEDNNAQ